MISSSGMRAYGPRPYMRHAPRYGYGGPPPWAWPRIQQNGFAKSEEILADGASAPGPHLVPCHCGNVIKASILRKRPDVICNCCGSSFPLEGIAVTILRAPSRISYRCVKGIPIDVSRTSDGHFKELLKAPYKFLEMS